MRRLREKLASGICWRSKEVVTARRRRWKRAAVKREVAGAARRCRRATQTQRGLRTRARNVRDTVATEQSSVARLQASAVTLWLAATGRLRHSIKVRPCGDYDIACVVRHGGTALVTLWLSLAIPGEPVTCLVYNNDLQTTLSVTQRCLLVSNVSTIYTFISEIVFTEQ